MVVPLATSNQTNGTSNSSEAATDQSAFSTQNYDSMYSGKSASNVQKLKDLLNMNNTNTKRAPLTANITSID